MQHDLEHGAIYDLVIRRINRRDFLIGGSALAASGMVGCSGESASTAATQAPAPQAFATIIGSAEDAVVMPEGFAADVLIRWGDPVVPGSTPLPIAELADGSMLAPGAAELQEQTFGCSADGMGVIPIDEDRLAICINHETPETGLMFAGYREAARERNAAEFVQEHPQMVDVMRASVGVSVVEFERVGDRWQFVADSSLNRRITADTPIEFAGPAAHHPWLGGSESEVGHCLGTFGNCAAGATPWGTYLTAEENTNNFFGNAGQAEWDPLLERANDRFGMLDENSTFRWEVADPRFDHAADPTESMKHGWIVEIDPLDPEKPIRKRTALGKFRHEGAETVLNRENRPVVYMGDDSGFEYLYKFVSDRIYDAATADATDELLDYGTLYVARLNDDGSGDWLPLVYGEHPELSAANGFESQADIVMRCREAADLVGATPLDRPEDVAVHPLDGRVYLACTQGTQRGVRPPRPRAAPPAAGTAEASANAAQQQPEPQAQQSEQQPAQAQVQAQEQPPEQPPGFPEPDGSNPRGPNPYGHILEFSEAGNDAAALNFSWEVFLLAGDPQREGLASEIIPGRLASAVAYYAGRSDSEGLSAFANPDNLGFDAAGNLWIVTDGSQPNDNNNGCFMCPTSGPDRGLVRQFMSGPVGCEVSGCTFSPDGKTLFLTVQHPTEHWPDGGDSPPRSSLIAIRSVDPTRRFYV